MLFIQLTFLLVVIISGNWNNALDLKGIDLTTPSLTTSTATFTSTLERNNSSSITSTSHTTLPTDSNITTPTTNSITTTSTRANTTPSIATTPIPSTYNTTVVTTDSTTTLTTDNTTMVTTDTTVVTTDSTTTLTTDNTTMVTTDSTMVTTDNTTTLTTDNTTVVTTDNTTTRITDSTTTLKTDTTTTQATDSSTTNGSTSTPQSTQTVPISTSHHPSKKTVFSETNIWIESNKDGARSWFIELSGAANESLHGLTLVIRDATRNVSGILLQINLTGALDENGFFIINKDDLRELEQKADTFQGILLLLYSDESNANILTRSSLEDYCLYAISPEPDFHPAVKELFQSSDESKLILSFDSFKLDGSSSLSRCQNGGANGFAVVLATPGTANKCQLGIIRLLEMRLTFQGTKCDSTKLPSSTKLRTSLVNQIITGVNIKRQCGLSPFMVPDFTVSVSCLDETTQVIPAKFTVHAAFDTQMSAIVDGYRSFVIETDTIKLDHQEYDLDNCTESCFKHPPPPNNNDDDHRIKVTIAVVVSCVGIFAIVLLIVIIYMKKKRRGILQFRMTRLDEDDDDLIGDMDDFVGNQGPTFNSFS